MDLQYDFIRHVLCVVPLAFIVLLQHPLSFSFHPLQANYLPETNDKINFFLTLEI